MMWSVHTHRYRVFSYTNAGGLVLSFSQMHAQREIREVRLFVPKRAESGLYRLQEKIITKLESTVSALTVDGCMFAQSNAAVQRWMGQAFNVPMFIYLDLCLAEKHTHHTAELPHRPTTDPGAACEIIASLVKSPRWAGVGDPIRGNMTSLKPDCHHTVPCTQPELFLLENTVYGNVVCNAFTYRRVLFFPRLEEKHITGASVKRSRWYRSCMFAIPVEHFIALF